MARTAVLTYHSHNIFGTDYAGNDHVALASDLRTLHRLGAEIMPLERIAASVASGELGDGLVVGLSFDDGPIFDAHDFVHPEFGAQRGFLNILRDFRDETGAGAQPGLHATSFVIASPEARRCMQAEVPTYPDEWLSDGWWKDAIDSGLMDIGNHSWDHVHHAVPETVHGKAGRDDFQTVDTFDGAEKEIRVASQFIETRTGKSPALFAFPFGHTNDYLVREYLPEHGPCFGLKAAFGTGGVAQAGDSVWSIPRLVCGHDWHSPQELERLIAG
jgi:hypothetical protein